MQKKSPPIATRSTNRLRTFFAADAAPGLTLMAVAVLAMLVANSPLQPAYAAALQAVWFDLSIAHWINDALMAVFFLMIGLEIKRELLGGALRTWQQRALPGFCALGGMLLPALIYVAVNRHHPETLGGWAIPAATDIAFALGVLSLMGPRVPVSLKVFLAALAILDDLGAVVIITLFYTSGLAMPMVLASIATLVVLFAMNKLGVKRLLPYLAGGCILWFFVFQSGVHATLAGVALAFCIPLRGGRTATTAPLLRLEHALQPWVAFAVIPVFGFANAGVALAGMSLQNLSDPVPLGVTLGLLLGKQAGVMAFAALAIRCGVARLPAQSTWLHLYGVALLCGIGFTMSLFIGSLAFSTAPQLMVEVKVGVLMGSILSAVAGAAILLAAHARRVH